MIKEINIEKYTKLKEKYCYKCSDFYEGFICGFEISADEKDTIEDIKYRRRMICELDKHK